MKAALAISTYFHENSSPHRFEIFKDSMNSLFATDFDGDVFVVDDGSRNKEHLNWLLETHRRAIIVERPYNGGISKCKNTCINTVLTAGYDVAFLADDDMLYVDRSFHEYFLQSISDTGYGHISVSYDIVKSENRFNNHRYLREIRSNYGCFFTFTRDIIDTIGYFKVFPYVYGCEHENFSRRVVEHGLQPCFLGITNEIKHTQLNPKSLNVSCRSILVDRVGLEKNRELAATDLLDLYVPFEE